MKNYFITGTAFTGNKGASGMATALIQNLQGADRNFIVMSYYPASDANRPLPVACELADGSPAGVVKLFFPSLWALCCRALHLPGALWKHGLLKRLAEPESCVLDASGISFVDGREKFLIFNILTLFPALAAGTRIVKVAQAMGPFEHKLNRLCAKTVLPHLDWVVARGDQTRAFLEELHLRKVRIEQFSDIAFSLRCTPEDARAATKILEHAAGRKIAGISPSQVVWKLCESKGIDYLAVMREVTEALLADGYYCVVFPHSARENTGKTHNNDLILLKRFHAMLPENPSLLKLEAELEAGVLRELIGRFEFLVASRFHAIISAMATGVPAVVIGWSHKYQEVLAPFELAEFVLGYEDLTAAAVLDKVRKAAAERETLSTRITGCSAAIVADNERFFALIS